MLSPKGLPCLALALACLVFVTEAACPNKCSGHGACGANDVCTCKQNWTGGDCSLRVCPYTRAWVDAPQAANDAHYYAECGNKGTCDRSTGICVCDAGYTGSGCRRQVCPNDCSGHGTCEFIDELSANSMTASWEEQKIMGCTCDPGFEGHDCSSRICPKGDDPVTSHEQYPMEQYLHYQPNSPDASPVKADIYLSYEDPYGNTWTTSKIEGVAAGTDAVTLCGRVQTALRALPNQALKGVTATSVTSGQSVTRTGGVDPVTNGGVSSTALALGTEGVVCKIVFPSSPGTSGYQNIIQCHKTVRTAAGYQPVLDSTVAAATCVTGEFSDTSISVFKLTELSTCSSRGLCDGSTGECQCFAGHRGLACETQEALV